MAYMNMGEHKHTAKPDPQSQEYSTVQICPISDSSHNKNGIDQNDYFFHKIIAGHAFERRVFS